MILNSQPTGTDKEQIKERLKSVLSNEPAQAEEQPEEVVENEEVLVDEEVETTDSTEEDSTYLEEDEVEDDQYEYEEQESEPSETYTVKHNGEEFEVTLDELKSGHMRDKDYRVKTTELSEQRKALAEEQSAVDAQRNEYAEKLEHVLGVIAQSIPKQEELDALLAEGNTEEYLRLKQTGENAAKIWQDLEKVKAEQAQGLEKQRAEQIDKMQKALKETMPQLLTEEGGKKVVTYLQGKGLTNEELNNVLSPVSWELAEKARLYDEMMSKTDLKKKKVKDVPKVMKKSARRSSTPSKVVEQRKAIAKVKKTGKRQDAHAALKAMFANQK